MTILCKNQLWIRAENNRELAALLNVIDTEENIFDFEEILPTPQFLFKMKEVANVTGNETTKTWLIVKSYGEQARPLTNKEWEKFAKHDFADIETWRRNNWGCPSEVGCANLNWSDCGCFATYVYMTEEEPPRKIIKALREQYPDITFDAHYAIREKEIAEYY